jgi:FkbM family methyltransferase
LHLSVKVFLANVFNRRFEREVPFLPFVVGSTDNCLHIGAGDGRHTFVMSRLARGGTIYAFEPADFSFAVLRTVTALHRLGNVRLFKAAVSDRDEDLMLVTPVKPNGRLGRSFAMIAGDRAAGERRRDIESIGVRQQRTRAVTVDGFVAAERVERVDFIRCDVEGAEARVLAGAVATIERDRPNMLVELHPVVLREAFGSSAEAVRDWLLARQYRMFHVRDGSLVASAEIIPGTWDDYFFIHPARAGALPPGPFRDAM